MELPEARQGAHELQPLRPQPCALQSSCHSVIAPHGLLRRSEIRSAALPPKLQSPCKGHQTPKNPTPPHHQATINNSNPSHLRCPCDNAMAHAHGVCSTLRSSGPPNHAGPRLEPPACVLLCFHLKLSIKNSQSAGHHNAFGAHIPERCVSMVLLSPAISGACLHLIECR
jgi:hypothetical protein